MLNIIMKPFSWWGIIQSQHFVLKVDTLEAEKINRGQGRLKERNQNLGIHSLRCMGHLVICLKHMVLYKNILVEWLIEKSKPNTTSQEIIMSCLVLLCSLPKLPLEGAPG